MHDFLKPSDSNSYGSWDKRKNPYPLRKCIIPNEATGAAGLMVPGALVVAKLGNIQFLNRYGFLLLTHDLCE